MTEFDLTFNKNDVETVRDLLIGRINKIKDPAVLFALFLTIAMNDEELQKLAKAFKRGEEKND